MNKTTLKGGGKEDISLLLLGNEISTHPFFLHHVRVHNYRLNVWKISATTLPPPPAYMFCYMSVKFSVGGFKVDLRVQSFWQSYEMQCRVSFASYLFSTPPPSRQIINIYIFTLSGFFLPNWFFQTEKTCVNTGSYKFILNFIQW